MNAIFLVLAILLLFLGHYFKTLRWKQFVEIYEEPKEKVLLRSLSFGYIINSYIPLRIGDLFRAYYSGKKMKNGILFSLATVIVDRYLDVIVVGILFLIFLLTGIDTPTIVDSAIFYVIVSITMFLLAVIAIKRSKIFKVIVKNIASIFNSKIELRILKLFWCFISSFKDIYMKMSRKKLLMNTVMMWMFYLLSYYFFALFISSYGNNVEFINIFDGLFSKNNLDIATFSASFGNSLPSNFSILMSIYIVSPLIIMLLVSFLPSKSKNIRNKNTNAKYINMLPHENFNDKLAFLEAYFSNKSGEQLKKYIEINRDISILQDYSAGSSATTMLCTNENGVFFRKYAFGDSGDKLYEQVKWLHNHEKKLKLTKIINEKYENGYCYYDMPYDNKAISFFNYVHSTSINVSWPLLKKVLDDLKNNLHTQNLRPADSNSVAKYINSKVLSNLEKIKNCKEIKKLLKYNKLVINGVSYNNLDYYEDMLSYDYLYKIFMNDKYSELHGDLTIENIIGIQKSNKSTDYYIIDPNTGNVHDSYNLDYGKLLQSLHGGYEFLMQTKNVDVDGNNINYLHTKSNIYNELYKKYHTYLTQNFSKEEVKSIYFHEIIHWLRLMPYKISKDEKWSVLFFAGLIMVLNEVGEMYGKK